jgi:hypothetical protein
LSGGRLIEIKTRRGNKDESLRRLFACHGACGAAAFGGKATTRRHDDTTKERCGPGGPTSSPAAQPSIFRPDNVVASCRRASAKRNRVSVPFE